MTKRSQFLVAASLFLVGQAPGISRLAWADPPPDKAARKAAKEAAKAEKKARKAAEKADKDNTSAAHSTPSGLQYVDLAEGSGPEPRVGQVVNVHYTGWLKSGKKFDSSLDRGRPFQFVLGRGQVIRGWDEGVATMKVGGKRKLIVPPELGYGSQDVGGGLIPANSTLIFEVELLSVQ